MPSRWALPISASARRCSESVIKIFLLICARHELYKVFLSAKISGCAQKAGTLDKGRQKGSHGGPRSRDHLTRLVAKEGQGGTLEIYTVAYTVSHFKNLSRIDTVTCKQNQGTQNPAHFTVRVGSRDRKSTRLNSSHLVISYAV